MNNKRIGTSFERDMCDYLARKGFWVHFISPDGTGAQPFDIVAVKNGKAYAIDCKTNVSNRFSMQRIEDNQILSFARWKECGNTNPLLAINNKGKILWVDYKSLEILNSIPLDEEKLQKKMIKTYDEYLEDYIYELDNRKQDNN